MNPYKIVSFLLAVSLLTALVRLVAISRQLASTPPPATESQVVYHNLLQRKSVRSFTDQPVSRAQLDTLLRVGMAAPTGRDMRPWRFVVVDDRSRLQALATQLPHAAMLTQAAAAIIVCGDLSITDEAGKPSVNWSLDTAAATENMLLQAEAMGLGAVWTGVYPYTDRIASVRQFLDLPDHLVPLSLVPIGHPNGQPKPKDKYDADRIIYAN